MVHITTTTTKRTRQEVQEEWRRHVISWKESGLSKRAYCTEHELSYQRFLHWSKEGVAEPEKVPQLRLVKLTTSSTPGAVATIPSRDRGASYPYRVELPKGYSVALQDQFSAATLVRLLNTLENL